MSVTIENAALKNTVFRCTFPASMAAILGLVCAAGGLVWAGRDANIAQALLEKSNVVARISSLQLNARKALTILASDSLEIQTIAIENLPLPRQVAGETFDRLLIVKLNPKDAAFQNLQALVTAEAPALPLDFPVDAENDDITGSITSAEPAFVPFVSFSNNIYSVAAAPLAGASGQSALVGMREVAGPYLSALARNAGTAPIVLVSDTSGTTGLMNLRLGTPAGNPAYLSWPQQRPGDELVMRWGLALAGLGILVALVLIFHARRAIRELRLSEERAVKLSGLDPLSGLPNRIMFTQLLDQECARAKRGGGAFALLYFDVDRFKEINETMGHDAGDAVIVGLTARLRAVLRPGDHLARLGGDEFAILQTEISGPKDVEALASQVVEAVRYPLEAAGSKVYVRLSGGIALHPQDAANRQDLMRSADEALSRAKNEGRDRYTFFQKRLGEDMRSHKTTEDELRHAIETGGLAVYYQPIMTVDGKRMACVEALVRWPHPVRGLIPPDSFIALAEERGLILGLGEYVLRQACRDGKRWPGLRVAVNVSPIQFRQPDFAKMVENVLVEEGFEANRLELELTEGVVIADADQAENVMMDLRALGCRLALDDFGTGYSSLVYLRRFAFDKIKIDRSFLEAMEGTGESAIIVHSIIHLGRALGLTVTAEGIENSEQQRFLQAAGAHELQGFLFSRAVPPAEIDRLLANLAGQAPALRSVA